MSKKKRSELEIVRDELEAIRRRDGRITPRRVVERARSKKNPLHKHFDWDDASAAEKHRIDQARSLIHRVKVRYERVPEPVRGYVSVTFEDNKQGYIGTDEALSDDAFRAQLLEEAFEELRRAERKYGHLQELAEVFKSLRRARRRKTKAA